MTSGDYLFVYGTLREGVPNQFAALWNCCIDPDAGLVKDE